MGYSRNPDVIISQQQQLIDKQDETLTLRDQFIEKQQEELQTLLKMCRAYETTIKLTMSYAKAIREPGLYTLIEESLKQGKIIENG